MRESLGLENDVNVFEASDEYIPTGSSLLNLALTDNPFNGYRKGKIVNIVGDSHSGKTFLFWQMAAEIAHDKRFDKYDIAYNDAEHGVGLNVGKLFGKETSERVEVKKYTTLSIEKNFVNIKKLFYQKDKNKNSIPFIHCTDSLDSTKSKEEMEKTEAEIGKRDYPDKPRIISEQLSILDDMAEQSNSLIMIISQTRKNIGVMFGDTLRRSGGDALRFYSWIEYWLAKKGSIKVKGRSIGTQIRLKVKKNKETGKLREIEFPIINDYGVDDISSIIDWMLQEKFWTFKKDDKDKDKDDKRKKSKEENEEDEKESKNRIIDTHGDFANLKKDLLIKYIEDGNYENDLKQIVGQCWNEIEESLASQRKARYDNRE